MDQEPTTGELMEAINDGFQAVQEQIGGLDKRLAAVELRLDTEMATKDFVDRRLAKTDGKINLLINVLEAKKVIPGAEKQIVQGR